MDIKTDMAKMMKTRRLAVLGLDIILEYMG
jgi:hypothetical protein